ncbi:hypothetical protein EON66_03510 [archaeon]|nr:MAG: hypothetical protein EON66_03510 [archaeon]
MLRLLLLLLGASSLVFCEHPLSLPPRCELARAAAQPPTHPKNQQLECEARPGFGLAHAADCTSAACLSPSTARRMSRSAMRTLGACRSAAAAAHTSRVTWMSVLQGIVPDLTSNTSHKGSHGKVLVVGGSTEYTGAPFYAGITALKTVRTRVHSW